MTPPTTFGPWMPFRSGIIDELLAGVEERLIVERVRDEERLHDAADDVRTMDAGPKQDGLERGDDRAADDRIGETLQRHLDDLEDEFRERGVESEVADAIDDGGRREDAIDDGGRREEDDTRRQRFERADDAARHGFRHLDAEVILFAVAADPRGEEADEDGRDDAVAARPGFRDDIIDDSAVWRRRKRRQDDDERREREDGSHDGVAAFGLDVLVRDGEDGDDGEHGERAAGDGVQRNRPVFAEDGRHDEAIAQRGDGADVREAPHELHELIKEFLFCHVPFSPPRIIK